MLPLSQHASGVAEPARCFLNSVINKVLRIVGEQNLDDFHSARQNVAEQPSCFSTPAKNKNVARAKETVIFFTCFDISKIKCLRAALTFFISSAR